MMHFKLNGITKVMNHGVARRVAFATALTVATAGTLHAAPLIDGHIDAGEYANSFTQNYTIDANGHPTQNGNATVYWKQDSSTNDLSIGVVLDPSLVDNSYGANAVGYDNTITGTGGHPFSDLTGSDKAEFSFVDANGAAFGFTMDYLDKNGSTYQATATSGEGSGGAGIVTESNSSMTYNFNNFGIFETDSPTNVAGWDFLVTYELKVAGSVIGADFDINQISIPQIHISDAKFGHPYHVLVENGDPIVTPSPSTEVPEPGMLAIFGLGLAGLVYARRKRAA